MQCRMYFLYVRSLSINLFMEKRKTCPNHETTLKCLDWLIISQIVIANYALVHEQKHEHNLTEYLELNPI